MDRYAFEEKNFLGRRLREIRLIFGFKQADVAKTLNVSRSTYSYYETGTTRPDPSVLGKLARYYGLPVEVFYEDVAKVDMSLHDEGRTRRTSRSSGVDPQKVGELLPAERSLILLLRSNEYVTAKQVLEDLEDQVMRRRRQEEQNRNTQG